MKNIFVLIVLFALTGCANTFVGKKAARTQKMMKPQELVIAQFIEHANAFELEYKCMLARHLSDKDTPPSCASGDSLELYMNAGITLSDLACTNWLNYLEREDARVSYAKDIFNIVGNLIAGIAGVNGSSSESLAKGSFLLSAGNAGIDSYKANFFLGVIPDIKIKMTEKRRILQEQIENEVHDYEDFFVAQRILNEYHDSCSRSSISNLLSTSLQNSKYEYKPATYVSSQDRIRSTLKNEQLYELIYPGVSGSFSNETLYGLYVAKIVKPDGHTASPQVTTIISKYAGLADEKSKEKFLVLLESIGVDLKFPAKYAKEVEASKMKTVAAAKATVAAEQKRGNGNKVAAAEQSLKEALEALKQSRAVNLSTFKSLSEPVLVPKTDDDR